MSSRFTSILFTSLFLYLLIFTASGQPDDRSSSAWEPVDLLPKLGPTYRADTAENGHITLQINISNGDHQHGMWRSKRQVEGGVFYKFSIERKIINIQDVHRCTPIIIRWEDAKGEEVVRDQEYAKKRYALETYENSDDRWPWLARPDIPYREESLSGKWSRVWTVFMAPSEAAFAVVELHLRWCAKSSVQYRNMEIKQIESPPRKRVKLASVFLPNGGVEKVETPAEAVRLFAPYVADAADQGAHLICLPEVLTKKFTGLSDLEVAEAIPEGTATIALIDLAATHNLYIVAGLTEADHDTLYNTAVLVGPKGYIGKYRKVVLTLEEANSACLAKGDAYPVFQTDIGRIGMMICYDIYSPDVARKLSRRGAEIIAIPVAGANPILAQARAIENQVYLVTSTYSQRGPWIKTGIFDLDGTMLDYTEKPGTIAIAEVEISDLPKYWAHLGDLKADLLIQDR